MRDRLRIGNERQSRTGGLGIGFHFLVQFASEKSNRGENSETGEDTGKTIARDNNTHLPRQRRTSTVSPRTEESDLKKLLLNLFEAE